jgi:hypothetical protein
MMSLLPDARAVLAHLKRHDPAGYASACYFALIELMGRDGGDMAMMIIAPGMLIDRGADPLREAKTRFLRDNRIDLQPLIALSRKRGEGRAR